MISKLRYKRRNFSSGGIITKNPTENGMNKTDNAGLSESCSFLTESIFSSNESGINVKTII